MLKPDDLLSVCPVLLPGGLFPACGMEQGATAASASPRAFLVLSASAATSAAAAWLHLLLFVVAVLQCLTSR